LSELFAKLLPAQVSIANPLQFFTLEDQEIKTLPISADTEFIRKELLAELKSWEIVDLMLFPGLKKLQVRITLQYDGKQLSLKELAQTICRYIMRQNYKKKSSCYDVKWNWTTLSGD
jgi:hypothetical protein